MEGQDGSSRISLDDLRRLNLIAAVQEQEGKKLGGSAAEEEEDNEVDFAAEELASALESVMREDQGRSGFEAYPQHQQPMFPQTMPQHIVHQQFQTPFPGEVMPAPGTPIMMPAMPMGQQPPRGGSKPQILRYMKDMRLNNSRFMKGLEQMKIIWSQGSALTSGDLYQDDFYFIRYCEEQNRKSMQQASIRPSDLLAEMRSLLTTQPPGMNQGLVPLPISQIDGLSDERRDVSKKTLLRKTAEWHQTNRILGRTARTDLKRPKQLISMGDEEESEHEKPHIFNSPHWILRRSLEDIANQILEIEGMHHLLEAKVRATMDFSGNAFAKDLREKQISLCDKLGQLLGYPSVIDSSGAYDPKIEVELERGWDDLFVLIWTVKGRKLVLRAIPCLLRPHLRSFLRSFCTNCAYFVCRNPDAQDDNPIEDEQAQLDLRASLVFSSEFRNIKDLQFVTDCLQLMYDLFKQSPEVLSVFLHIPAGQEIIRTIMQHGKALAEQRTDSTVLSKWQATSSTFLTMMQEAVGMLEDNS